MTVKKTEPDISRSLHGEATAAWLERFDGRDLATHGSCKAHLVDGLARVLKMRTAMTLASIDKNASTYARLKVRTQVLDEIISGRWFGQMVADPLYSPCGEALVDNMHEVIEARIDEILGSAADSGKAEPVAANRQLDIENFALAVRLALISSLKDLENALLDLERMIRRRSLDMAKAEATSTSSNARTLNQFGNAAERTLRRLKDGRDRLHQINYFGSRAQGIEIARVLSVVTNLNLRTGEDGGNSSLDFIGTSGLLKELGVELGRMCQGMAQSIHNQKQSADYNRDSLILLDMMSLRLIGDDLTVSLALQRSVDGDSNPAMALAATTLLTSILSITLALRHFNKTGLRQ